MFPFVPVLIELAGLKSEFTSTVSSNKKKAFVAENVGAPTLTADVDEAAQAVREVNQLDVQAAMFDSTKENRGKSKTVKSVQKSTEPFPKRCLRYLPNGPRNIITVIWDNDGNRDWRTFRKAKIFRDRWHGSPVKWRRRRTIDELTGEVIEDVENTAVIDQGDPTEHYVLFTPGDGTVMALRHKDSGQLHFPGGTLKGHQDDSVGDLINMVEKQLGLTFICPTDVTRFRRIGCRQYYIYNMPLQLSKERLSQFRKPGSEYSRVEFVSVEQPRAKANLTGDHIRMCDLFGDLAAKCLPVVNKEYCSTLLCECGQTTCLAAPIVEVPDNLNRFHQQSNSHESGLEAYLTTPPFYTNETADYARIMYGQKMTIDIPLNPSHQRLNTETVFGTYMTDEELQEKLMTKAGIAKLHKQFWHLTEEPLFKRLSSVVPESKHAVLRRMCHEVCAECSICRSHARPGMKPKTGGLWARERAER